MLSFQIGNLDNVGEMSCLGGGVCSLSARLFCDAYSTNHVKGEEIIWHTDWLKAHK